jgi:hypothetical protein
VLRASCSHQESDGVVTLPPVRIHASYI